MGHVRMYNIYTSERQIPVHTHASSIVGGTWSQWQLVSVPSIQVTKMYIHVYTCTLANLVCSAVMSFLLLCLTSATLDL